MSPDTAFNILLPVSLGLLGCIVGSFLNVCIFRLPRNCLSIVHPGSHCPQCQTSIAWYDNLPILSYLVLGGTCRHCGRSISLQYPMVELLNGLLYVVIYFALRSEVQGTLLSHMPDEITFDILFSLSMLPFWCELLIRMVILSSLIVISLIDLQFRIIPDVISIPGILLGLAIGIFFPEHLIGFHALPPGGENLPTFVRGLLGSVLGMITGGGVIFALKVFGEVVFQKPSMGYGDVKFMAALGALLGWIAIPLILFIASMIGSVIGIFILWFSDEHYVPFGPFLSAGAGILLVYGQPLIEFVQNFFQVAFTGQIR